MNFAASSTDVLASNLSAFLPMGLEGTDNIQMSLNHAWRLKDATLTVALRRSYEVAATIERDFEQARARAGLSVDQRILAQPIASALAPAKIAVPEIAAVGSSDPAPRVTLRDLYDAYMSDPTRDRSPRTPLA